MTIASSTEAPTGGGAATTTSALPEQQLWCYNSLKSKAEVEAEGKRLLRCTRCRRAWYASKEDQKEHWNDHKKSCKPQDPQYMNKLNSIRSANRGLELVQQALKPHPHTVDVLKKMRALMGLDVEDKAVADDEEDDDMMDIGLYLHGYMRIFPAEHIHYNYMKSIWAAPGMVEFLLTDPLTNVSTRRRALKEQQSDDKVVGEKQDEEEEKEEDDDDDDSDESSIPGYASEWAYLLFNILVRTAVGNVSSSMVSVHDGRGRLRTTPLAKAAANRVIDLFANVDVREDCGDALAPVASFLATMCRDDPGCRPDLLARGIAQAILDECQNGGFCSNTDYIHEVMSAVTPDEWSSMPDDRAVDLLWGLVENGGLSGQGFDVRDESIYGKTDMPVLVPNIVKSILSPSSRRLRLCELGYKRRRFLQRPYDGKWVPDKDTRLLFYCLWKACNEAVDPMVVDIEVVEKDWSDMVRAHPPSLQMLAMMELIDHHQD